MKLKIILADDFIEFLAFVRNNAKL